MLSVRNQRRRQRRSWLASWAVQQRITRRGWVLFGLMGVIWGVPYLFIKVAVEHMSPSVVVFGRTSIAAVLLVPIAIHSGALRAALPHWRPIMAFAALEMAVPWLLLTNAEQHLPSGLTGLLIACVPIVGSIAAYVLGDRSALRPQRLLGIAVGLGGVSLLVAADLGGSGAPWWSVAEVLLVCVGYATAPFIANRRLGEVPALGVVALSLSAVAVLYAPFAWLSRPETTPPSEALLSVLALALICTALAFIIFFQLIASIGPMRATLITFVNPAVAVIVGALVLDEQITIATVGGFALVLVGCWLSTRTPAATTADAEAQPITA